MKIFERIESFNRVRGLASSYDKFQEVEMLLEEVQELRDADNWEDEADAFCDLIVFAVGGLVKLGLDVDSAMDETLMEIESRNQCPVQAHEWYLYGSRGEKWQKDKNQCKETLYKANYKKATK